MDIMDLLQDCGLTPKRKAACHGGEYFSPCPFCKEGDDRFIVWPNRRNKNGELHGGRYSCRVCGKYGDAITFLMEMYGATYPKACAKLKIEPRQREAHYAPKPLPKLPVAEDPSTIWQEKAKAFVEWSHTQLMRKTVTKKFVEERGFTSDSVESFKLGFNPTTLFRERLDWGLEESLKENGQPRKIWLPKGIVIPTFSSDGRIVKVKIRRSDWKEGEKLPKYVEVSGFKQFPSIFGDTSLASGIVLESELDGLLIQQEAAELVFCVSLGGSTKPIDLHTEKLLKNIPQLFFCPDFDAAGATAWVKWKKMFPRVKRILAPEAKSAGDYFIAGGNLREWIESNIQQYQNT